MAGTLMGCHLMCGRACVFKQMSTQTRSATSGATSRVACRTWASPSSLDVSWTAAYPLNVNWLLKYYDDVATARKYWPSLKAFVDGQIRVAKNVTANGLVDFWTYGDWKAIERTPPL